VYSTNHTGGRRSRLANRTASLLLVLAGVLACLLVLVLGFAVYLDRIAKALPDLRTNPDGFIKQRTSVVYARDGSVLAEWHGEQDRTIVAYAEMPSSLRDAAVAVEDSRFYVHHGIDTESITRAVFSDGDPGQMKQGGSTITQQVVKNLPSSGKRSLWSKFREALTANALETRADKSKVLELYLNTVYLGRGYYGVESASRHYFGTSVNGLTLAQSATLAGIIDSPTKYCPLDHPEAARIRRDYVLDQMAEQGYITEDQRDLAQSQELTLHPVALPSQRAPYFTEWVKQVLTDKLGAEQVYGGGLRVFTTLDPALQARAEAAARQLSAKGDPEVAIVAVDHARGQVLALVGGRDFRANQFNLAVQGHRQPGSSFKAFVLAAALQDGIGPGTKFDASPYSVQVKDGVWNVSNYENEITSGWLTLSAATDWSVNAVFARLIMRVGPEKVVAIAKKMGITTPLEPDPAIALGGLRIGVSPLEMASAYGTIANGGMALEPTGITLVLNDRGEAIYGPQQTPQRAMTPSAAAQESQLLHGVVEKGTGTNAKIGRWAAGKTGTTQSYRDAWFVGWSGDLSTAVWVGHRDGQVAMVNVHGIKVAGGSYPARIWAAFMKGAGKTGSSASSDANRAQPARSDEPVLVRFCQDSGDVANGRCPRTTEAYLSPAVVPKKICSAH
jgi:penicillin-binding protein 1A